MTGPAETESAPPREWHTIKLIENPQIGRASCRERV